MTVPANLAARHYAEQAVLAAVLAEREAAAEWTDLENEPQMDAWRVAENALNAAASAYYAAVQAERRVPDPAVENIADMREWHENPPDIHEPDLADRYDSGYVASPAVADGRAADEFYGRND